MSPLNHKWTTSSLAPPIFYVAKNSEKKDRRLTIGTLFNIVVYRFIAFESYVWENWFKKWILEFLFFVCQKSFSYFVSSFILFICFFRLDYCSISGGLKLSRKIGCKKEPFVVSILVWRFIKDWTLIKFTFLNILLHQRYPLKHGLLILIPLCFRTLKVQVFLDHKTYKLIKLFFFTKKKLFPFFSFLAMSLYFEWSFGFGLFLI